MKITVDKQIFEIDKEIVIGVVKLNEIKATEDNKDVLQRAQKSFSQQYTLEQVQNHQDIARWRNNFAAFQGKFKKNPCSIYALAKRVIDGGELPSINYLVDSYNAVSLNFFVPVGGDNLDAVEGDILLTRASGKEEFQAIGSEEVKKVPKGEVIYRDAKKVLCRRWNWRECDATKLDADTKNAIIYIEGFERKKVEEALNQFVTIVQDNAEVQTGILDVRHNAIDLASMKLESTFTVSELENSASKSEESNSRKEKQSRQTPHENKTYLHWADQVAQIIVQKNPNQKILTCASGITPSGIIHIGNFREIITTELVYRALQKKVEGTYQQARFIYSWDEFDVFRKVPKNMPQQEMLQKHLRKSIVDVPDPYGKEISYAKHNEVELERHMPDLGIFPEYIYQADKYRASEYAEGMKIALEHTEKIKEILNAYRKEELEDGWSPVRLFSSHTQTDEIEQIEYLGGYDLHYKDNTGFEETIDLRTTSLAKLAWRVDWPMRWKHEQVVFEPGGKDHSAQGGSFDTGKKISKEVYGYDAPHYIMYDFIRIKGKGGKISSSSGDVITVAEVLEIYEPMMVRWLFAGTRAGTEFAISFDLDVLKIYEDFDKCERIYYGAEQAKNNKEEQNQKRIYELSAIDESAIPQKMPYQPSFRHLTTIVQIHQHDVGAVVAHYKDEDSSLDAHDEQRIRMRARCASNWLKQSAPEDMVFSLQEQNTVNPANDGVTQAVEKLKGMMQKSDDVKQVEKDFFAYLKENSIDAKEFFTYVYQKIIAKEKGPRLIPFLYTIGLKKVEQLL